MFANSVIARKNDEAIYKTVGYLDCFVPRNDAKKLIYFVTIPKQIGTDYSFSDAENNL